MNNFLEVVWINIFYNIVSILIGLIVLSFGIIKIIKEKKLLFSIICKTFSYDIEIQYSGIVDSMPVGERKI